MIDPDLDKRLSRIESRLVQLMLWAGMKQGKDGQIEKNDTPGGIFKALREYQRHTDDGTASPEAEAPTKET